jgi:uncharacterized membrane protein YcaP (DUF421 family)
MDWITTTPKSVLMVFLSTIGIYIALILFTRIAGIRSFSKMSGFDFAITVGLGSVIASVVLAKDPPLLQGVAALGSLFLLQITFAILRKRYDWLENASSNCPRLIMAHGLILHDQLRKAQITVDDLHAKLREANVLNYDQIEAVIAETTGDVSVLHSKSGEDKLDKRLLDGVIGAEEWTPRA